MRRGILIGAVFLLGVGASQLVSFFASKQTSQKPVEITKEATSASVLAESTGLSPSLEETIVTRVIDGDTIEIEGGKRVRYIGIDTPEVVDPGRPVECFGREASQENKRLVDGKTVRLERDISETDKYGRLLRYAYVENSMVNDWLVRQGFAHSSTYPPDVKYQEQFRQAEAEARENSRGLWGNCPTDNTTIQQSDKVTATPEALGAGISGCTIKGNISASGEKIYHVPGCGSYEKTSIDESAGERWFCSESDAAAAGWRKAKNCP